MTTAVATQNGNQAAFERALIMGDLTDLSTAERLSYYHAICESLDLNPLTRPFEYLSLPDKKPDGSWGKRVVMYARKDATEQLRSKRNVSLRVVSAVDMDGIYVVTAEARMGDRVDTSIGAVSLEGLKGVDKANALMKCETKAKRRVTLSICGLGMLDETEIDSIPGARTVSEEAPQQPAARRISAPMTEAAAVDPDPARTAFRSAVIGRGSRAVCQQLGIEPEGTANEAIEAAADIYGWDLMRKCIEDGVTITRAIAADSEADDSEPEEAEQPGLGGMASAGAHPETTGRRR